MSCSNLMYLPKSEWSPRFDETFYSVTFENTRLVSSMDQAQTPDLASITSAPDAIDGRNHFPAYYYELIIHRGRERMSVWRRYSHFKWLYRQLKVNPQASAAADPPTAAAPSISFPAGNCFYQKQDDQFAQDRLLLLRDWLNDVLVRPGYASHPAVVTFLELQS